MRARDRLAENLRLLRAVKGWSQEELAQVCDLHRTYISMIERSACGVTIDNLERLAIAFGSSIGELMSEMTLTTR